MVLPILYSFRRCPYAIRARMALHYAGISVEHREVLLRDKPAEMLAISPKGTVPVLQLPNGKVLEESLDIMYWALSINDPDRWLPEDSAVRSQIDQLIAANDTQFKPQLDRYKYPDRYPEASQIDYRVAAEQTLQGLEERLGQQTYLCAEVMSLADVAIFPFIRQFARVDLDWFALSPYKKLYQWLIQFEGSLRFEQVMQRYPTFKSSA